MDVTSSVLAICRRLQFTQGVSTLSLHSHYTASESHSPPPKQPQTKSLHSIQGVLTQANALKTKDNEI